MGPQITGKKSNNVAFTTYSPGDPSLVSRLESKNVVINAMPPSDGRSSFWSFFP